MRYDKCIADHGHMKLSNPNIDVMIYTTKQPGEVIKAAKPQSGKSNKKKKRKEAKKARRK